jgi:hypothetical protein
MSCVGIVRGGERRGFEGGLICGSREAGDDGRVDGGYARPVVLWRLGVGRPLRKRIRDVDDPTIFVDHELNCRRINTT